MIEITTADHEAAATVLRSSGHDPKVCARAFDGIGPGFSRRSDIIVPCPFCRLAEFIAPAFAAARQAAPIVDAEVVEAAILEGMVVGMYAFAHWKDGQQFVGTCGHTLKDEVAKLRRGGDAFYRELLLTATMRTMERIQESRTATAILTR